MRLGWIALAVALAAGCGSELAPNGPPAPVPMACAAPVTETACGATRLLEDGREVPCAACTSTPAAGTTERENNCLAPDGALCVVSCSQCGD
jgi:hypothetical protein